MPLAGRQGGGEKPLKIYQRRNILFQKLIEEKKI